MSSSHIRPRFNLAVDLEIDEAQTRIIKEAEQSDTLCEVKVFPGYLCLRIPESERHFWSPRLTVSFDRANDGKTHLAGVYGPNANVWSLFLFGYLISGSLALFSGIFGFVQLSLSGHAWGLWIFGLMLAAMGALYLLAQAGQKLGAAQTSQLHSIVESAMERMARID